MVILGIVLAVSGIYFGYKSLNKSEATKANPSPSSASSETKSNKYTLTQVAEHSTKNNCWLVIDGNVYDVTPFVASGFHPGKEAILQGCGKDATTLFNTRPMGSGTSHSERARKMLPKYFIGTLEG